MWLVTILAGLIFDCRLNTLHWKYICKIDKDLFGVCIDIFWGLLCMETKRASIGNIYPEYCSVSRIYVDPGKQLSKF